MPTINENQFFTVLVEWAVDPSQQQEFVNAIAEIPQTVKVTSNLNGGKCPPYNTGLAIYTHRLVQIHL